MTIEPPKGIRANLIGSFASFDPAWFENAARPINFRKLAFGLSFFHASVLERKKFGPLGWNIRYDFAESDLRISLDQLRIFVEDAAYPEDRPPFAALAYLTGECNYGGRVTDDNDRRTLMALLSDVYNNGVVHEANHALSPSGVYAIQDSNAGLEEYVTYIRSLPFTEGPEVFGLNENANISTAINETNGLLGTALSLQPRGGSGGGEKKAAAAGGDDKSKAAAAAAPAAPSSPDDILLALTSSISTSLPDLFDIEAVEVAFPVAFEESMNTVLTQECMRFNTLLSVVKRSLVELSLAIKGLSVMSAELESVGTALAQGRVPDMWKGVAYPSVKPLGSWTADLIERLAELGVWISSRTKPGVFWISGFFFTQSFLTGARQNYARKYAIPIDELAYDYRVLTSAECDSIHAAGGYRNPASHPEDGVYVHGLFLQSARWDAIANQLAEATPRELFSALPVVHLLPRKTVDIDSAAHVYHCPTYKTSERAGILSTTGHSTNYVMPIALPMGRDTTAKHWVKRGCALFTQLDT